MNLKAVGLTFEQMMWDWAWESTCPKEWGCRKKAQDLAQRYKINGSSSGPKNEDFASFKVKLYNGEEKIGCFGSGVEKSAAQNMASQGPVHDCKFVSHVLPYMIFYFWAGFKLPINIFRDSTSTSTVAGPHCITGNLTACESRQFQS